MGFYDTPTSACFIEDLLDFNIDESETADGDKKKPKALPPPETVLSFPECEEEEELEWLSNKVLFPSVDTFVPCVDETFADIIPYDASAFVLKHSPDSVLENSNSSVGSNNSNNNNAVNTDFCSGRGLAPPIRRHRSKKLLRRQRGGFADIPSEQWFEFCGSIQAEKTSNTSGTSGVTGRKCTHCGSEKTPQWRAGPDGPKTLCNACGVRYKSGRLCPEYRPANSPTFSSKVHSNSHRKIVEMRKMKQMDYVTINPVDNG